MKPKYTWGRRHNGTYSQLRKYRHWLKRNGGGQQFQYRKPSNNQLKMRGLPMNRSRQRFIAEQRYFNSVLNRCMEEIK